ncbi:MAG: efflux RND transporter permease subunit, partial [Elainellaceae cyanobacterium]
HSLGTAVFGGMFVATLLSLFVVPILYVVIKSLSTNVLPRGEDAAPLETDKKEKEEAIV